MTARKGSTFSPSLAFLKLVPFMDMIASVANITEAEVLRLMKLAEDDAAKKPPTSRPRT